MRHLIAYKLPNPGGTGVGVFYRVKMFPVGKFQKFFSGQCTYHRSPDICSTCPGTVQGPGWRGGGRRVSTQRTLNAAGAARQDAGALEGS